MLAVSALGLTACAGSTGVSISPKAADFRPLPPEFRRMCNGPVKLPEVAINQAQVEDLWIKDRSALKSCRSRHAATVRYFDKVTGEKVK